MAREPTFDADGYPTEATLQAIREWPPTDCRGLVEFVCKAWEYSDYVHFDGLRLELHTGGWSGNESIVGALQDNTVWWAFCWQQSKRGGHYWFELPESAGRSGRVIDHHHYALERDMTPEGDARMRVEAIQVAAMAVRFVLDCIDGPTAGDGRWLRATENDRMAGLAKRAADGDRAALREYMHHRAERKAKGVSDDLPS